MAPFKILIADDATLLRRALIGLIGRLSPDWEVCGEAGDGEEALRKETELRPDVVLVDLSLPLVNGVQVIKNLQKNNPSVVLVLMSEQSEDAMRRISEEAGVRGIPKSRLAAELPVALKSIAAELLRRG
ncbi:MAG TPA: response regulator transcription factor [Candidatus Sulfotelmatobacter sp.]|jgi:DNA-binding NarL/FixJ family response regulator